MALTDEEKTMVADLRKRNLSYNQISNIIGKTKNEVGGFCRRAGLAGFRSGGGNIIDFDTFINKFRGNYGNRYEYISGFNGCDSEITIKCKRCKYIHTRNAQITRRETYLKCPQCEGGRGKRYCKHCGKLLAANNSKYCSDDCRFKHTTSEKVCEICGEKYRGVKGQKYCSDKCCREKQLLYNKINFKSKKKKCECCGKTFNTKFKQSTIVCSRECYKEICKKRKKEENRKKEIRRRHKLRDNGNVNYAITLSKALDRLGDTCAICGVKVDATVHSNHDLYPSIDHIVPVALGGTHTWDNVQIAHRICNTIKGAQRLR